MDEPLGALDADFRESMRSEIKALHIQQKGTTVYVTHDQIEAMAMADRIVIMSQGVVQQVGTPAEVYHAPVNLFVARFIGSPGMNLVKGAWAGESVNMPGGNRYIPALQSRSQAQATGQDVVIGFRPEAVVLQPGGPLSGTVISVGLHGSYTMLAIDIGAGEIINARVNRDMHVSMRDQVRFGLKPTMVRYFDPQSENAYAIAEQ